MSADQSPGVAPQPTQCTASLLRDSCPGVRCALHGYGPAPPLGPPTTQLLLFHPVMLQKVFLVLWSHTMCTVLGDVTELAVKPS